MRKQAVLCAALLGSTLCPAPSRAASRFAVGDATPASARAAIDFTIVVPEFILMRLQGRAGDNQASPQGAPAVVPVSNASLVLAEVKPFDANPLNTRLPGDQGEQTSKIVTSP